MSGDECEQDLTQIENSQFGDLTKAAAQEVVEWGRKERKAFESLTGKDYEFGV